MIPITTFLILGFIMLLAMYFGSIFTSEMLMHVKNNHVDKYELLTLKNIHGISRDELWPPPIEPAYFFRFIFSTNYYSDEIVRRIKTKIRVTIVLCLTSPIFAMLLVFMSNY